MSEKEKMNQDGAEEKAKETKPAKADKEKAKAKADKEKKPGVGKRIARFFRELRSELKKVSWPTRADTLKKNGHRDCLRHRRRHHRLDLRRHCQLRDRRAPLPLRPALRKVKHHGGRSEMVCGAHLFGL